MPPTRDLDNENFIIHNFEDALGDLPRTDLTVTRLFLRIVHKLSKYFETQIPPLMRALDPNFIKELVSVLVCLNIHIINLVKPISFLLGCSKLDASRIAIFGFFL